MKLTTHLIAGIPGQPETHASVAGDTITIDGVEYPLGALQEGDEGTMEGETPFVGSITREADEIACSIIWRYDPATAEPVQPTVPPVLTVTDGPIPDPITRRAAE